MNGFDVAVVPTARVSEPGNGEVDIFPLSIDEKFLQDLLTELFVEHWQDIQFGSLIQGSVLEISLPSAPSLVRSLDGYLTIACGDALHFHLCIGINRGSRRKPVPEGLQQHRKVARAEFYRFLNSKLQPVSWGLRLFNGANEQMLTVYLPNPFLADNGRRLAEPDWSKLALWQKLRVKYLGLEARDDSDYLASRFEHCACC